MTSQTRPYHRDDWLRSRHVMDAAFAPDASFAVYLLTEIGQGATPDEDKQVTSLWRVDLSGGEPRRLTAKEAGLGGPQIAPDGGSVYFMAARGGPAQVWRLPLDGGEAEAVTSLPQGITAFSLSPDGERLALAAFEQGVTPSPLGPHKRINRRAWRFDVLPGYLQDLGQAIYVSSTAGGEAKPLTGHDGIVALLEWSPGSDAVAAAIVGKGHATASAILGDLCVVTLTGEERTLVSSHPISGLFWTADGTRVGYVAPPEGDVSRQSHLFLVDRNGGDPIDCTPGAGVAIHGAHQPGSPGGIGKSRPLPSHDGADVLAAVAAGGRSNASRIALAGDESVSPVHAGDRVCKLLARSGERILFSAQDFHTPAELFLADLASGEERRLTGHNDAWRAEVAWPHVERVVVTSDPGVEVEGWVMIPTEGEAPYKTLLFNHGGPHAGWGATFNEDLLEMTGAGYAVAFANPRGSSGYGDAFAQAIIGCWGEPEFKDFTAFLDELVARGIADPDRLGVTGVSGGGHLTAWLIGQTNRFQAAVPEQGVYNMFSMYGVSDAGVDLVTRELGGAPHEQPEIYWRLSPLAHAHTCTTPTLLIQGENDVRCPMEQAEQLYTVLKRNGCEVELLRLANCNHAMQIWGPPALRRTRMDALNDWFGRYIR